MNANYQMYAQGTVTKKKSGEGKTGPWCLIALACEVFNGRETETKYVNCWFGGKSCQRAIDRISEGCCVTCVGTPKPGKPFETNKGNTITPLDLSVTSWFLGGEAPTQDNPEIAVNPFE